MPTGYSKRALVDKLGIKPGFRMQLCNAPKDYLRTLEPFPHNAMLVEDTEGEFDFIQLFVMSRPELERDFPPLKHVLKQNGMLWISWPKKSSGVETDLTGDVVRTFGLQYGLVDVKVCAVDEIWSGLKFVYRLKDRK